MSRLDEIREQFHPAHSEVRLIGLSGYARSGKDTVGGILTDDYGFTRYAFADGVRDLAEAVDPLLRQDVADAGWEAMKANPLVREDLQNLGVGCREVFGSNVWVDLLFSRVSHPRVVVTDVRFPNEAEEIVRRGGQVWRIDRPGTKPVNGHVSETALDCWSGFSRIIINDGTVKDLRRKVLSFRA